jgi:N-acetylated-alpha-linked acidic dipeptidase
MQRTANSVLVAILVLSQIAFTQQPTPSSQPAATQITGFRDAAAQNALEQKFMAVPDPKLAEAHLKTLTSAPHMAGTPEDKITADYVAQKYRAAGLETRIDEYKVYLNYPIEVHVTMTAPAGVTMNGPTREQVNGDPYQDDKRVVMPFNGSSPSGDVQGDVVYANYGRPEDFAKLKELGIDLRGKIVLVRYGGNFRGVKSFIAQEQGAAGVLIYSDPIDDGYFKGDMYPKGPYRPETGVQRGSIEYMFEYPGDITSPGVAAVPSLPMSERTPPEKAAAMPKVPTTPISYGDARPILENLGGPESPRDWQGALPFTYHVGPGPSRVHVVLKMDFQYRTIWNVIGVVKGSEMPEQWVVSGNHRDAWVYGAVDPNSGTAAQLEAVHGIGELLKTGWKPKRTIVFASWDGEEEGLIGSTEFVEQYGKELDNAAAYFNMDVGVGGPNFGSSAVPSLKQFVRDVTKMVPSPKGGTVYDVWKKTTEQAKKSAGANSGIGQRTANAESNDVNVGDLGSGSDYTAFLQHQGVPSTDIGSGGPYGVYHSTFDDFAWFKKFGDPTFVYEQQMARVMGLQVLRMAQTDVLPFDYELYGKEVGQFLTAAQKRVQQGNWTEPVDFGAAMKAAQRFEEAGKAIANAQRNIPAKPQAVNVALLGAEHALLDPQGLPNRPFFRHTIFAPGEYTGYAAVVIPGVNEGIDKKDAARVREQLQKATAALDRASSVLEAAAR